MFWVGHHIFSFFRSRSNEEETPGKLSVKSKLSPHSGYVALKQLSPIYKKGA